MRARAAFELGALGGSDKRILNSLQKALDDRDWGVCGNAALALVKIDSGDSEALVKEQVMPRFMDALRNEDWEIRHLALRVFAKIGKRAQGAETEVVKLLSDSKIEVRLAAAYALWRIDAVGSVPQLITALGDSSWQMRQMSARALGGLKAKSAVKPLTALLEDSMQPVRWMLQ